MPTMTEPKLHHLKQREAELIDRAKQLKATADAENREMSEDEFHEFTTTLTEAKDLGEEYDERIKAEDRAAQQAVLNEAEVRLNKRPQARTTGGSGSGLYQSVTGMYDRIMDDPKRGYKSMGHFAIDIYQAGLPGQAPSENLLRINAAATGLNQTQGSQGGFLVPPQFSTMIWDGMNEMPDNLMQYCDSYPVTGESLTFNANAETSRATGSRYGGIRAYWLAEAAQKTSSMPRFRQMKLEPHELAALVYVTDKLLRNAPALEAYLRKAGTEEIMWLVNDAIINGTGAGQPLGIMNSLATISVPKETNQLADTIEVDNINKMYARFLSRARTGAAWYINQDVEAELEGLNVAVGTGGFPVYLPSPTGFPTITETPNARLKGRPVRPVEYMQTLGDKGDILLANLGYYALGVQGGIQEAMSIHLRFDYNETAFRFVFAVDGQPWINTPLTPAHGSNTLSPFVTLDARA